MTDAQTRVVPVEAIKNLADHQQQLDMDGCMVGVSRQALDETLAYITGINSAPAAPVQGEGEAVAWRDMSECPRDDRMVLAKQADGAMMVWRADILMHGPTPAHLDFKATGWIGCEELDAILDKGEGHE